LYFIELALICITLLVMQKLLTSGKRERSSANKLIDHDLDPGLELDLAPVEIAYLSQDGDTMFALLVLVFDMLHRESKARLAALNWRGTGELALERSTDPTLDQEANLDQELKLDPLILHAGSHYEERLKAVIKQSVTNWGEKKVQNMTGMINIKKDPVAFVRKLPFLYKILSAALRGTAQEILKDPRHIRKYISKTGLMRIVAEIGASGYKESFERELKEELLRKGLLLEDQPRHELARSYFLCFAVAELALIALILRSVPSHLHGGIIFLVAACTAFAVKVAIGARSFIPLYDDLSEVLKHAPRHNFRTAALSAFLKLVNFILNALSVIVFMSWLLTGSLILYFTHTVSDTTTYLMLLTMMVAQYLSSGFLFEGYRLSLHQSASPRAVRHIKQLKARYRNSSIDALKSVLTDGQYTSEMSYLLAIYGLETLFFI